MASAWWNRLVQCQKNVESSEGGQRTNLENKCTLIEDVFFTFRDAIRLAVGNCSTETGGVIGPTAYNVAGTVLFNIAEYVIGGGFYEHVSDFGVSYTIEVCHAAHPPGDLDDCSTRV